MTDRDTTERRRAEQALQESERRLRAIWETAVEGIVVIDDRGVIESLNPAACQTFGYRAEEVIGQNVSILMPSPDRERHDGYIANYLRTGEAKIIGVGREVVGRRKDGSLFPMELAVAEVPLNGHRLFTGFVRDITERKRAEAELREREERMRAILETVVEGILTIDTRGIVESLNPAACRIFGYTKEEVIGRNVSMLMPSPDRERHDGYIANYEHTGEAKIIGVGREVVGRRKDGSLFPMHLAVSEVQLGDRRLFTGLVRDITARRKLEQAVMSAAEQERSRIGREMHDGLGQQLGGLLFLMKGLQSDLKSAGSPQAATAGQICDEITLAMSQARSLAHELYAVRDTPDGLVQALENLAERVATTRGASCVFLGDASLLVPSQIISSHLFRIAQEAVHNALKHGRARRIELELSQNGDVVVLSVRDNGVGLLAQTVTRGLGLRTMEQRARLIAGTLVIRPQSVGGVEVKCLVPMAMAAGLGMAEGI